MSGPPLRVAFVLPYGERSDGFFPDTFLGQLCAETRGAGHHARIVRVYYEGDRADGDREVAERLTAWLEDGAFDLVVLERAFDLAPIRAFAAAAPGRRCALVARGDSIEPLDGIDLLVGATRGPTATGRTRRSATIDQVADAFARLVHALAAGAEPAQVPGVAAVTATGLVEGAPLPAETAPRRLRPILDQEVIAVGEPPPILRRTLFGNAGCPYAADPLAGELHRGLELPAAIDIARLGCAFCSMGGDYQRRPDADVIASLVDQALHVMTEAPHTRELVLNDQAALRYLAALVRAAHAAGVPPVRWLFAARSDTFVRESGRVAEAVEAARETGHCVECYLTGFEAFSPRELERYNKGVTVADQLAAVDAMRALHLAQPTSFAYADARGHSLILWNPWTSPEDLGDTIATIRAHGLAELFDDVGRNRLRLHPDLPIYYAAERDGALIDDWDRGDRGAGRAKGYHAERPWRFLDVRTRLAWELAGALRERLGRTTELAQLAAIAAHAAAFDGGSDQVDGECLRVLSDLELLAAVLRGLTGPRQRAEDPVRGSQVRAHVVHLGGDCNNRCAACPNRDVYRGGDPVEAIHAARVAAAPIVLAGREPTLHRELMELIQLAAGDDARPVGVVSNGRRFCYGSFAGAARAAGLTGASIKLFAPGEDACDRIGRDPGGYQQAIVGCRALRRAGIAVEVRAPLDADNLAEAAEFAVIARQVGANQLRLEGALDAIGLGNLAAAAVAAETLIARCADLEIPVEVSPLEAGTTLFDWLPIGRVER